VAFTFKGTYTQNGGDDAAAGTVAVYKRGTAVALDTATLDATGSYELIISAEEGEMKVVETMTGVAVRTYEASVSRGSVTDTSRDIGTVGAPAVDASVAGVTAAITAALAAGPFAPTATGATAATRYVGGTAAVAPTTGAHLAGDWVTTLTGQIFICTVAGTPGTWVLAGSGAYAPMLVTANRQTASYGLVLADAGLVVEMNVASANNLTVPLNSTQAFPVGTVIEVFQYGAGQTTILATGGVTLRSSGAKLKLSAQYAAASLRKIATDEWQVVGELST